MARRWYLPVVIFTVAVVTSVLLTRSGGSFTTTTIITFSQPASYAITPDNGTRDENVIAFAGAVANEINKGTSMPQYASAHAPYFGAGLREGVHVGVPNSGGQWAYSFTSAEIHIQIVGRTREWVRDQQRSLVDFVLNVASAQQEAAEPRERITANVEPLSKEISHVTSTRVSRLAAYVAMLVAAAITSIGCSVAVDNALRRRPAPMTNRARSVLAEDMAQ